VGIEPLPRNAFEWAGDRVAREGRPEGCDGKPGRSSQCELKPTTDSTVLFHSMKIRMFRC